VWRKEREGRLTESTKRRKKQSRGEEDNERKKEGLSLEARMLEKDSPTKKHKEQQPCRNVLKQIEKGSLDKTHPLHPTLSSSATASSSTKEN
jgi:hypothetical protein